jgi:hypothetical protein
MGDEKITELLAKLEKLDPDTYVAWCELFYDIWGIDYGPLNWDSFTGSRSLLQGVIQDAIAVHDWEYCVRGPLTRLATCAGDVITGYSEIWAGGRRIRTPEVQERDGQTPAEAILAAYVAALEAEAAR